jgi:hypothetical protein
MMLDAEVERNDHARSEDSGASGKFEFLGNFSNRLWGN